MSKRVFLGVGERAPQDEIRDVIGSAVNSADTVERVYTDYSEEYLQSVKDFKESKDALLKEYESIRIPKDNYLLRIHKFTPNVKGGKIIMLDNQGNETRAMEMLHSVLGPCALVLQDFEGSEYKKGDLVLLSTNKIRGYVDNPVWQLFEQALESKNVEAIEPEDKRKKIPFLEAVWMDYMFIRPWLLKPQEEDRLTYLLNSYEVRAAWGL
jgi:hypothetical protein